MFFMTLRKSMHLHYELTIKNPSLFISKELNSAARVCSLHWQGLQRNASEPPPHTAAGFRSHSTPLDCPHEVQSSPGYTSPLSLPHESLPTTHLLQSSFLPAPLCQPEITLWEMAFLTPWAYHFSLVHPQWQRLQHIELSSWPIYRHNCNHCHTQQQCFLHMSLKTSTFRCSKCASRAELNMKNPQKFNFMWEYCY